MRADRGVASGGVVEGFDPFDIRSGQGSGTIRSGDPCALAHLYEVILDEFVSAGGGANRLTKDELHDFIGGALRADF